MARSAVQQALANARGWVNTYAPDVYRGRTDQGVDWIQSQPYLAPTAGTIAGIDPNWYKGTPAIYLKFDQPYIVPGTSRSYPGAFFAETSVLPGTRVGQRIEAGQPIAGGSAGGGLGEQGFAAPVGGAWRQAAYGQYTEGQQTQAGQDWLAAIGGASQRPPYRPAATPTATASPFAVALSQATGGRIFPSVAEAWHRAEGGPASNPLNIGPGQHFANPVAATAAFMTTQDKAGYYRKILAAKTPAAQIAAIKASPWDAGHYANGVLDRTFAETRGQTAPAVAGVTGGAAPPAPGGGVHTGVNTQLFSNVLLNSLRSGGGLNPATLLTAMRAATAHLRT